MTSDARESEGPTLSPVRPCQRFGGTGHVPNHHRYAGGPRTREFCGRVLPTGSLFRSSPSRASFLALQSGSHPRRTGPRAHRAVDRFCREMIVLLRFSTSMKSPVGFGDRTNTNVIPVDDKLAV